MKFIGQAVVAHYIIGSFSLLFKCQLGIFSTIKLSFIPITRLFDPRKANFTRRVHKHDCIALAIDPGLEQQWRIHDDTLSPLFSGSSYGSLTIFMHQRMDIALQPPPLGFGLEDNPGDR